MGFLKSFLASYLLMVAIGVTSTTASAQAIDRDKAYLVPIISMLLEGDDSSDVIADDPGGNFVVSSRAFDDTVPDVNCDQVFTSTGALEDAATTTIAPGTTLCLADGTYNSLELNFGGAGTADAPIKVAAQNSGGAIISGGDMGVNMRGSYVVLQGIVFRDGSSASSDFLQTRGSGTPCNHCRVTEISVINLDEGSDDRGRWIHMYGSHNRIDHNWFSGKSTGAPLLATNRDVPEEVEEEINGVLVIRSGTSDDVPDNFHVIDHNYFGDRSPTDGRAYARNGDNEFEGIQLGTSFAHEGNAATTVAFNYFERIDGEAEVISVKSSGNVLFNNTVRDSYGSITNRHGARTLIANNFVIGDGHPFSGGLRIVDDSHRIINNYVEGARFLDTRFHGGIVLHNTDGSTSNGYQVFENNLVAFNTVTNSVNSLNVHGGNRNDPPRDVRFVNNVIDDAVGPVIRDADIDGLPAGSVYAGNYVEGPAFSDDPSITSQLGFIQRTINLEDDAQGIARPTPAEAASLIADTSVDISSAFPVFGDVSGFEPIVDDIDGQSRASSTTSGADQDNSDAIVYGLLSSDDVGPVGYRPTPGEQIIGRVPLNNPGFDDLGQGWTISAGAEITTNVDDVFAQGVAGKITDSAGRISQNVTVEPNTDYAMTAFTQGPVLLGANVDGVEVAGEANNSSYKHTQFEFNSGTATSVTLFAGLDDFIENSADIQMADFPTGSFSHSYSADNPWIIYEGVGIGQVADTSTNASGSSRAARLRHSGTENGGSPTFAQVITDIPVNTDVELSVWVVADSSITATMKVFAGDLTPVDGNGEPIAPTAPIGSTLMPIASKLLDYGVLDASGSTAPEANSSYRQDTLTFNSGSATTLTISFEYTAHAVDFNPSDGNSEIRLDDVELTFDGPTPAGEEALVDEIRLVSFPGGAN